MKHKFREPRRVSNAAALLLALFPICIANAADLRSE